MEDTLGAKLGPGLRRGARWHQSIAGGDIGKGDTMFGGRSDTDVRSVGSFESIGTYFRLLKAEWHDQRFNYFFLKELVLQNWVNLALHMLMSII